MLVVAGSEHSMDQFNGRVRLTPVKWLDDSLAIHKSSGVAWGGRERKRILHQIHQSG